MLSFEAVGICPGQGQIAGLHGLLVRSSPALPMGEVCNAQTLSSRVGYKSIRIPESSWTRASAGVKGQRSIDFG